MFAKLLRAVEVAAREGGAGTSGQHDAGVGGREGQSFSVPVDNIERAIKRGTGDIEGGARYEEVTYEGYAPGGVACSSRRSPTTGTEPARTSVMRSPTAREPR